MIVQRINIGIELSIEASLSDTQGLVVVPPSEIFGGSDKGAVFDPQLLSSLYQLSTGSTAVTAEDPVGFATDQSGKGNHAIQATGAARPTLSARYNKLTDTSDFGSASLPTDLALDTGLTDSEGGTEGARLRFTATDSSSESMSFVSVNTDEDLPSTLSLDAKADTYHEIYISYGNGSGASRRAWVTVDLLDGSYVTGTGGEGVTLSSVTTRDLGDGWWRINIEGLVSTDGVSVGFRIRPASELTTSYTDGDSIFVARPDLRLSAYSGMPEYQRVGDIGSDPADYDSVGFLKYLVDDEVDNAINVTLEDLGTDATLAYVDASGVTILTGQTIGAGARNILESTAIYGWFVIDRPLTYSQMSILGKWLAARDPTGNFTWPVPLKASLSIDAAMSETANLTITTDDSSPVFIDWGGAITFAASGVEQSYTFPAAYSGPVYIRSQGVIL